MKNEAAARQTAQVLALQLNWTDTPDGGKRQGMPHTHTLAILAHPSQDGGDSGDAVRHKSSRGPRPRNLQVHRSSVPLHTWKRVSPARLSLRSNRVKIITDMEIWVIALGFRCDKYSQCNAQSHEGMPLYWDFYTRLTQVYHVVQLFVKSVRLRDRFMSFEKL